MISPISEKVLRITADVLQIPSKQITPLSSTENIENWDSVRHLNLVLALEQEFGIQLEPEDVDDMNSVECIVAVIENKIKHP